MKRFTLLTALVFAVFALVASSGLSANTSPKNEARAAAVTFLNAWKTKNAKVFCRAQIDQKQAKAKASMTQCVTQIRNAFKSGSFPLLVSYRIRQTETFRKGSEAFVDVRAQTSQGMVSYYLHFIKTGNTYTLKQVL